MGDSAVKTFLCQMMNVIACSSPVTYLGLAPQKKLPKLSLRKLFCYMGASRPEIRSMGPSVKWNASVLCVINKS